MDHERDFLRDEAGLGNSVEKRRVSHVYGWGAGVCAFVVLLQTSDTRRMATAPPTLRSNVKHVQPFSAAQVLLYVPSPPALAAQAT